MKVVALVRWVNVQSDIQGIINAPFLPSFELDLTSSVRCEIFKYLMFALLYILRCSGGKDSCYSMVICKRYGHEIVALANLLPTEDATDDLESSFMYQTVAHQLVAAYSECMGLPLYRRRIAGSSTNQQLVYEETENDEVEDLYELLAYVKQCIPDVQAVSSGAIASDYQRTRVERVCARLGLVSLAYLWHQPQEVLLHKMVSKTLVGVWLPHALVLYTFVIL